jgi:hypothetical protein
MTVKVFLKEYGLETLFTLLALTYAIRWSVAVQPVPVENLTERLQSNDLLLNTIGIGITAVSILFPVTLGIYAFLQERNTATGTKRFFRGSVFYLLSLGFGLWAAVDIPVASHRVDKIALATDPVVLTLGAFQGWFFVAGLVETLVGAWAMTRQQSNHGQPKKQTTS